ncbi:uncharacterized protein LTR77_006086 [Saxophila tyrrhenica]|uniref:Uncharacterized protein n=1 Tax=Saxophila tyrrhenica TaxID=1690608 RepID=A0AAV9P7I0_9PEZI|nr:hypothetical protein LTR77_006086 [Saxophila tyrrhenica]
MKVTAAAIAITGLISSASAQYFSVIAARSASPIHLRELAADAESIWIGKETSAYCPKEVVGKKNCPKGKYTTFAGGDKSLSMGTVVPGGQQVYIDPKCGSVKYTIAHSAAMPEGAIRLGWSLDEGESFGTLSWRRGLLACPVGDADDEVYKIHANIKGVKFSDDCLGFNALTTNQTKASAWQYT